MNRATPLASAFHILDRPVVFLVALAVMFVIGLLAAAVPDVAGFWERRTVFLQQLETIYLLWAPWFVMRLSPGLLEQLRPIVKIPEQRFERYRRHIASHWPARMFVLLAFALALIGAVRLAQLVAAPGEPQTLSGFVQLPVEIIIMALSLWRMVWLGRLALEPLQVNIFNPAPTYGFGLLSFSYAALLSLRILIRFLLFGTVFEVMRNVFVVLAMASLLMLVLPLIGVSMQLARAKVAALGRIDDNIRALTQPFVESGPLKIDNITQTNLQLEAWYTVRNRVNATWTWPVPNSLAAVQALAVSASPVLLPPIKTYVLPLLTNFFGF